MKGKLATSLLITADCLLLLAFAVQAVIAACLLLFGTVPLPRPLAAVLLERVAPEGLRIEAAQVRLSPAGAVACDDLRLFLAGSQQPALEAGAFSARLKLFGRGPGDPLLERMTLSDCALYQPAQYSPDGMRSPLLEQVALTLVPDGGDWHLESVIGRLKEIRFRGNARWARAPAEPAAAPPDLPALAARFYAITAELLPHAGKLENFTRPTVTFSVAAGTGGDLLVGAFVESRRVDAGFATAENVRLGTAFRNRAGTLAPTGRVALRAGRLTIPAIDARVESLSTFLAPEALLRLAAGEPTPVEIAAAGIEIAGFRFNAPVLSIDPGGLPVIRFSGSTDGFGSPFTFAGAADVDAGRLRAQMEGAIDVATLLPRELAARLPVFDFERYPHYEVALSLTSGYALERASLRARSGPLRVAGLRFDRAAVDAAFADGTLTVDRFDLVRGAQDVAARGRFDVASKAFRVGLRGAIDPNDYAGLLPRWWGTLFRDFEFGAPEGGRADFVIYGVAEDRMPDTIRGAVDARALSYRGVFLDRGELTVRGNGRSIGIHSLDATSGSDRVRGDIRIVLGDERGNGLTSVRLDLAGRLGLDACARLAHSEDIAAAINRFEAETAPTLTLNAAIFLDETLAEKSYLDLAVAASGAAAVEGFRFADPAFDLLYRDDSLHLRGLTAGFAGGTLRAGADLDLGDSGRAPCFAVRLDEADAVKVFEALEPGLATGPDRNRETRLSLTLDGCGSPDDIASLEAAGRIRIDDRQLGSIDIFGPLSSLLRNTPLGGGLTSFALHRFSAGFRIEQGILATEDAVVEGPETRILGRGTLSLADQRLDFRANVNLIGNVGRQSSPLRRLTDFVNPIPTLLSVNLTGTLHEPRWRLSYDPRNFLPKIPRLQR